MKFHTYCVVALLTPLPLKAKVPVQLAPQQPVPISSQLGIIYQHPIQHRLDPQGLPVWDQPLTYAEVTQRFSGLVLARNQMGQFLPPYRLNGWTGQSLVYLNIAGIAGPRAQFQNPNSQCTRDDWAFKGYQNQAAMNTGDFCELITAIQEKRALPDYPDLYPDESWFLHGDNWRLNPKRLVSVRPIDSSAPAASGYEYRMNPASRGWQTYLARRALRELRGGFDVRWNGDTLPHPATLANYPVESSGIFLDNLERRLNKFTRGLFSPDGLPIEYREANDTANHAAYAEAIAQLTTQIRNELKQANPGYLLWGNLGDIQPTEATSTKSGLTNTDWDPYLERDLLDGAMLETFALRWEAKGAWDLNTLRRQLATLERWQQPRSDGHANSSLLAAPTGFSKPGLAQEARLAYGLYLLIARPEQTLFNLHEAQNGQKYSRFLDCPDYLLRLGVPLGSYYEDSNQPNVLKRRFSEGLVQVNLNTLEVSLPQTSPVCSFPNPVPATP